MTAKEIVSALNLEVFTCPDKLDRTIDGGYVSDLLSDVMGFAESGQIWVTLQTHKNIMAIASLKELSAIILIKGCKPDQDTITMSIEEGIPILGSSENCFETAGKLYAMLSK